MASNETIQSLATLLQALRGFNEPRREMEMYAKKSMLQLQNEKSLAEFKYNLERIKAEEDISKTDSLIAKVKERQRREKGYDPERPKEILESGKDVTVKPVLGNETERTKVESGKVYGTFGFTGIGKGGVPYLMSSEKAKTYLTRRALYDLNENVEKFIQYEAEDAANVLPGSSQDKQYYEDKQNLQKSLLSISNSGETQNFNRYEQEVYNELLDTLGI